MVKNQSLVYFRQVIDFILTAFTFSEYCSHKYCIKTRIWPIITFIFFKIKSKKQKQ